MAGSNSTTARADRDTLEGWDRHIERAEWFDAIADMQRAWLALITCTWRLMTPPRALMDSNHHH